MGIADRLKDLKTKAVDATAERSDKIHEAVEKVASTADERTGGKYHDRIQKVGAKAGSLVDGLTGSEQQPGANDVAGAPVDAAEGSPPVEDAGSAPAEPTEAAPATDAQAASATDAQAASATDA